MQGRGTITDEMNVGKRETLIMENNLDNKRGTLKKGKKKNLGRLEEQLRWARVVHRVKPSLIRRP